MPDPPLRPGVFRVTTAAVTLSLLIAGCSVGGIRRTAPPPGPVSSPAGTTVEQVPVPVPVPADHALRQVEFVDAAHGYALFVGPATAGAAVGAAASGGPRSSAAPGENAVLFGTVDAGRSWRPVRHPRPLAREHQLYAGNGVLVLFAEPDGWFVSLDAGRSFAHHRRSDTPPAAYRRIYGRLQVCCDTDDRPKVWQWRGDGFDPLPAQPPLPDLSTVAYGGGRLVAAGLRHGRPYVSVSGDGGRSWSPATAPDPDGGLFAVRVQVAADGDAWLLGQAGDPTRFPRLWRDFGVPAAPRWLPREVADQPAGFTSAVPLGGGLLAVTGPQGPGLVSGGRYARLDWPVGGNHLRMLDGGTIFAADPVAGRFWLGTGRGIDRAWTVVRFDRV
ncbi:hypothetical protein [Plantactinospora sp. CA-290183]|uniref:hypothetical protein n=1 Tax=Plantactinospora sp. CA-290183 TaxID=3240006 RepID=UPI003D9316AC